MSDRQSRKLTRRAATGGLEEAREMARDRVRRGSCSWCGGSEPEHNCCCEDCHQSQLKTGGRQLGERCRACPAASALLRFAATKRSKNPGNRSENLGNFAVPEVLLSLQAFTSTSIRAPWGAFQGRSQEAAQGMIW